MSMRPVVEVQRSVETTLRLRYRPAQGESFLVIYNRRELPQRKPEQGTHPVQQGRIDLKADQPNCDTNDRACDDV